MEEACFVARSGSHMYGLATDRSDEDHVVVWSESASRALRAPFFFRGAAPQEQSTRKTHFQRHCAGSAFAADKCGEFEGSGHELVTFVELLCKGNPKTVELLWVADGERCFSQWPWCELVARREAFRTARAFAAYRGLAKDALKKAARRQARDEQVDTTVARDDDKDAVVCKLYYYAFHRLFEAARFVRREPLHVRLRDDERRFVLEIRAGTVARGECERKARDLLARNDAAHAAAPLPDAPQLEKLIDWLVSVRTRQLRRGGAQSRAEP